MTEIDTSAEAVERLEGALTEAIAEGAGELAQSCLATLRALLRERDALKADIASALATITSEAEARISAEAERDAARAEVELLNVIERECWDVRCVDEPTPGGDDGDVGWVVIEHHMAAPNERQVGYGKTPQEAIRAALAGEGRDDG